MPLVFNRTLIIVLILFGSISFANASTSSPGTSGWTWVQDSPLIFCGQIKPTSQCVNNTNGNIVPTVAGSIWILQTMTPTSATITSICTGAGCTGTSAGWTHCTNCVIGNNFFLDAYYNLCQPQSNCPVGTTTVNFVMSGSVAFLNSNFVEILPPDGTFCGQAAGTFCTPSLDTSGHAVGSNCNATPCSAVSLTTTATDFIWQNPGGNGQVQWNSWSSPYVQDANGGAFLPNTPVGTIAAPTVQMVNNAGVEFVALAFKSTAGTFTPPTPQYSIVNFSAFSPGSQTCGACTLTIPTTGSGHLLYLEAADEAGSTVSAVSWTGTNGGTWVVPSGSNTCQFAQTLGVSGAGGPLNAGFGCAWVLSTTAGATQVHVTMTGSGQTNFAVYEIASTIGTFSLVQQSLKIVGPTLYSAGAAVTSTGANYVAFQAGWVIGGSLGPNFYPTPYINQNGTLGPFNYFAFDNVAVVALLDTGPTVPTPTWINANQANGMFFSAVAFTASGVSAAPNPPTGLSVVVQ